MVRVVWITAFLLLAGWAACEISLGVGSSSPTCASVWRRTRDGWKRQEVVFQPELPGRPAIHPLLLAALQVLVPSGMVAASQRGWGATFAERRRPPAPVSAQTSCG